METNKLRYLLLTVAMGFAGILLLIGLMDVSSALAQEQSGISSVQLQPPTNDYFVTIFVTGTNTVSITDLSENPIGEGTHEGEVRCVTEKKCSQKTQLYFTSSLVSTAEYEYKFSTRQSLDPEARRAVVGGTGKISNNGQKERFSFTATFQDNGDGTLWVGYEASRPDASFIIQKAPGLMEISRLK